MAYKIPNYMASVYPSYASHPYLPLRRHSAFLSALRLPHLVQSPNLSTCIFLSCHHYPQDSHTVFYSPQRIFLSSLTSLALLCNLSPFTTLFLTLCLLSGLAMIDLFIYLCSLLESILDAIRGLFTSLLSTKPLEPGTY